MKNLVLLIFPLLIFSCIEPKPELEIKSTYNSFQEVSNDMPINSIGQVKVVLIDSCEYIFLAGSHGEVGFCHKGNCKNIIHNQTK